MDTYGTPTGVLQDIFRNLLFFVVRPTPRFAFCPVFTLLHHLQNGLGDHRMIKATIGVQHPTSHDETAMNSQKIQRATQPGGQQVIIGRQRSARSLRP